MSDKSVYDNSISEMSVSGKFGNSWGHDSAVSTMPLSHDRAVPLTMLLFVSQVNNVAEF